MSFTTMSITEPIPTPHIDVDGLFEHMVLSMLVPNRKGNDKRAANAYFCFRAWYSKEFVRLNPSLESGASQTERSKRSGEAWGTLPKGSDVREVFEGVATRLAVMHKEKFPDFKSKVRSRKHQPRRRYRYESTTPSTTPSSLSSSLSSVEGSPFDGIVPGYAASAAPFTAPSRPRARTAVIQRRTAVHTPYSIPSASRTTLIRHTTSFRGASSSSSSSLGPQLFHTNTWLAGQTLPGPFTPSYDFAPMGSLPDTAHNVQYMPQSEFHAYQMGAVPYDALDQSHHQTPFGGYYHPDELAYEAQANGPQVTQRFGLNSVHTAAPLEDNHRQANDFVYVDGLQYDGLQAGPGVLSAPPSTPGSQGVEWEDAIAQTGQLGNFAPLDGIPGQLEKNPLERSEYPVDTVHLL